MSRPIFLIEQTISDLEYLISGECTDTQMDYVDEIKDAIEALKMQIPRKPIGEHYARMRCPACGHRIPSGQGSSSRRRDNWCNYCGQAIDWFGNENGRERR